MRLINLVPRLLPCRKTEREPGRSDHMGQYDVSRRPDNRLSHVWISTFSAHCVIVILSYTALVLTFPIVCLFRKLHPSQMRVARLIARLEEQSCWKEDLEEFFRTVHRHLVLTCHLIVCLGVPRIVSAWMTYSRHTTTCCSPDICHPPYFNVTFYLAFMEWGLLTRIFT